MPKPIPLVPDRYYHIVNRGNNRESIFVEERNFAYFLQHYIKYIDPIVETFAYCLMKNHVHFLVKIGTASELVSYEASREDRPPRINELSSSKELSSYVSQQFATCFGTYSKAFNKTYKRTGSLFQNPFKRIQVDSDAYFTELIRYIHNNPVKHGFTDDITDWKWSSYNALLAGGETRIQRATVLEWFDNDRGAFVEHHQCEINEAKIRPYIFD